MKKKVLSILLALLMVLGVFMPLASASPTTVLDVVVTSNANGNILNWLPFEGATDYEITVTNPSTPYTPQVSAFTVSATHPTPAREMYDLARNPNLIPGTQYRVRVRALSGSTPLTDWNDLIFTLGHFAPIPTVSGTTVSFTALPAGHGVLRYEVILENLTQPTQAITRLPIPGITGTLSVNVANFVGDIAHPGLLPAAEYRVRVAAYVQVLTHVDTNNISTPRLNTPARTLNITSATGSFTIPRPAVNTPNNTLQLGHDFSTGLFPTLASNPTFILQSQSWSFVPPAPANVNLSPTGLITVWPTALEGSFQVQLSGLDISGNPLTATRSITLSDTVQRISIAEYPSTAQSITRVLEPGTGPSSQRTFVAVVDPANPVGPGQHIEWVTTGFAPANVFPLRGPETRLTAGYLPVGSTAGTVTLTARIMQGDTEMSASTITIPIQGQARTINVTHPALPANTATHVVPLNFILPLSATVAGAPGAPVTWHAMGDFVGNPGTTGSNSRLEGNGTTAASVHTGNRPGTLIVEARDAGGAPPVRITLLVGGSHTVTFNPNGGILPSDTSATQETAGTFATALTNIAENGPPRRLGHAFVGWFDTAAATGGNEILPTTIILRNETVFARWRSLTSPGDDTAAVPAGATIATVFPDTNLANRVVESLRATFSVTTITPTTRIFASDLAAIETLLLERPATQPILDLRGIPTLTGVTEVRPTTGLTNQTRSLPNVPRAFPLNHENAVRAGDGSFVVPTAVSNNGAIVTGTTPANNTIRWTTAVPANVLNVTYTWNVADVQIGNQTVLFSGTATLPFRAPINFVDVNSNNWFYAAVNFVAAQEYMTGTTTTPPLTFEPNRTLTRAEVAVILHRMAGAPAVTGQPPFSDVTAAWQRTAVTWAAQNNIVGGIGGGLFAPNSPVTREQFAAMFHRFAVHSGVNVSVPGTAGLTQFPDYANVSSWAIPYMTWAIHTGLITGSNTPAGIRLNPGGTATRAECAQMIQRYATNIR